MAAIGPLLTTSTAPWIVTGHSLGGSLSILVSLLMANDGYQVTSINYTPAPAVGAAYRQATAAQAQRIITNNFLENEELDIEQQSDQFSWLYLAGAKMTLPDVGKTAGAASGLPVQLLINRDNLRLVEQNLDPVQTALTMSRLVYLQLLAGEYGCAAAMQAQVEKHYPLQAGIRTGLVGLNRVLLAKHRG
jgi:hypothetical protein